VYEHSGLRMPPLDLQEGNEGRFVMHLAFRGVGMRIWGAQEIPILAFEEVRPIAFSWAIRLSEEGSLCATTKCNMLNWSVQLPENWIAIAKRLSLEGRFWLSSRRFNSTVNICRH
jgi:hypothetical protein